MSVYGWLGLAMIVFYVGLILYIMLASAKCQPVEDFKQPELESKPKENHL